MFAAVAGVGARTKTMLPQLGYRSPMVRASQFFYFLRLFRLKSFATSQSSIALCQITDVATQSPNMAEEPDKLRVHIHRRGISHEGSEVISNFKRIQPKEPVFSHLAFCIYRAREMLQSERAIETMIGMAETWWDSYPSQYMPFDNREDAEDWVRGALLTSLRKNFPVVVIDENIVRGYALAAVRPFSWAPNDWANGLVVQLCAKIVDDLEAHAKAFTKDKSGKNLARYQHSLFIIANVIFQEVGGHVFSGHIRRQHHMSEPIRLMPPTLQRTDLREDFDWDHKGEAGFWMEYEVLGGIFQVLSMHREPMYGIQVDHGGSSENRKWYLVSNNHLKATLGLIKDGECTPIARITSRK